MQDRSILDRDQILALYLVLIWVKSMQKIPFAYKQETSCGSLDTASVSCICIADPNFMYRAQPWAYQTCAQLRHFDEGPRARLKHLEYGDVEVLVFGGEREVGLGHDLVSRLHPQLRTALAPVVRNASLPPLQLFQLKQWIPCL